MSNIDRAQSPTRPAQEEVASPLPAIPVPAGAKESLQEALLHSYAREVALLAAEDQEGKTANAILKAGHLCRTPHAFAAAWAAFGVWYRSPEGAAYMAEHHIIPEVSKQGVPKLPNTLKSQFSTVHTYLQARTFQVAQKVEPAKQLPDLTTLTAVAQAAKLLGVNRDVVIEMRAAQAKTPANQTQDELRALTLRTQLQEAVDSIKLQFGILPIKEREAVVKAAQHAATIAKEARAKAVAEAEKEAARISKEAAKLRPPVAAGQITKEAATAQA